MFLSKRRNIPAARTFFKTALHAHDKPVEVIADLTQASQTVIEEQIPRAYTEQYSNNRVECDHERLKSRLRPMRGLTTDGRRRLFVRGDAFSQNLRGHDEFGPDAPHQHQRIAQAFDELIDLI